LKLHAKPEINWSAAAATRPAQERQKNADWTDFGVPHRLGQLSALHRPGQRAGRHHRQWRAAAPTAGHEPPAPAAAAAKQWWLKFLLFQFQRPTALQAASTTATAEPCEQGQLA
jgi:hypothetical protein